jgi:hypothetical protein
MSGPVMGLPRGCFDRGGRWRSVRFVSASRRNSSAVTRWSKAEGIIRTPFNSASLSLATSVFFRCR